MDATILIAETDTDALKALDDLLFDLGCFIDVVQSGAQALEYFKSTTPSLAILSASLSDLSGLDVCFRTKRVKRLRGMLVLILCAEGDAHSVEVAHTVQADGVLTRPLEVESLRQTVTMLLKRASHSGEDIVMEFPD